MIKIDDFFSEKFPFACDYFSKLLNLVFEGQKKFPQALIFEGSNPKEQYFFALELARILNCQNKTERGRKDCDCINCRWIKTFSHPAVNNVSQIHFKGENDESKTVISVKQAREIERTLSLSSDYHRFFIFFSSHEKNSTENEPDDVFAPGYEKNPDFTIEALDFKTFHPTTPNALLKSIEEPPERTTFVFLTKSREDILQTIVSRCQIFKLNSKKIPPDYQKIKPFLENYPNWDYLTALSVCENLQKYIKENSRPETVLNQILEYLKDFLKKNHENPALYFKIKKDIGFCRDAMKQLSANMQEKVVFETLMLKIVRGF